MGRNLGARTLLLAVLLGLVHILEGQFTAPSVPLPNALLIHGMPIGNSDLSKSNFTWRVKRDVVCQSDEYKHTSGDFCCKRCIRGFYKVAECEEEGQVTQCKPCDSGSYTATENGATACMLCETCREALSQVVKSPCTRTSNVLCGCPDGMFKVKTGNDDFYCKNCTKCINGSPHRYCEDYEDTICRCNLGFFHDEGVPCRPCNECLSHTCQLQCPSPVASTPASGGSPPLLIATVGVLALLLVFMGIWIVWKYHFKDRMTSYDTVFSQAGVPSHTSEAELGGSTKKHLHLPGQPLKYQEDCEVTVRAENAAALSTAPPLPDCVEDARRTQLPEDPSVLYTVVDTVPPNRWKELVRRLGLRECDIQRIEIQTRNFREGQYEMLQMWRNQTRETRSTVEAIYKVLHEMDLSGCSEIIQESLHVDV